MSEYHEYMSPPKGIPVELHDALTEGERALLRDFLVRLREAEAKHPVFAEGPWQGLGFLQEEVGELVRATTHNEGEERMYDEALDVLCTAFRFARKDWKREA